MELFCANNNEKKTETNTQENTVLYVTRIAVSYRFEHILPLL